MMQKTYLSRAVTRAMSLDHPIGDPFGGTAYGEKNDPISAIISIGTMAGTYAAAGSFAAMGLFSGLAFAGAALNLAGNVTGNKTLMKIGMVAGIAGGIGMLAESVMETTIGGTLGETFNFGEGAGSGLSQTAPTTAGPQTPVVDGQMADLSSSSASSAGSNLNAPAGGGVNMQGGAAPPLNASGGAASSLNMAPQTDAMINAANATSDPLGSFLQQNNNFAGAPSTDAMINAANATSDPLGSFLQQNNNFAGAPSTADKFLEFANKNQLVTLMGFQAVGGLSDFLSGKTDAEIAAYEAQVGFADARALQIQEEIAKEKQRRINLNAGYNQVNTAMPINTGVSIPAPGAPGLIAGNMPPRG
jgi:hypothetical protein